MRNMSFSLTTPQMRNDAKDITRRLGWWNLQPGQHIRACEKCMGLKKGEKLKVLCIIEVVSVRREPLRLMLDDIEYGFAECIREGFGDHPQYRWPSEFVAMFCASHKGCTPDTEINRIEFKKVPA